MLIIELKLGEIFNYGELIDKLIHIKSNNSIS